MITVPTESVPAPREQQRQARHDIDPKLLEFLVCPITKSVLSYSAERQELISKAAGLAYPIRDGIPIMIPDEARVLSDAERD